MGCGKAYIAAVHSTLLRNLMVRFIGEGRSRLSSACPFQVVSAMGMFANYRSQPRCETVCNGTDSKRQSRRNRLFRWVIGYMNGTITSTGELRKELGSGVILVAAIYSIVYGLTAKTFSFRSRAWRPGEERVEFKPQTKDRLVIVFLGLLIAIVSGLSLSALWRRH